MSHLILVDGNNLGFSGMANPRLSAGERNTHSTFTFIRSIRRIFLDNPDAFIMVLWDGRSWRNDVFKDYKANREVTEKQVADRKAYYQQQNDIRMALRHLGVCQVRADNWEADDLAAKYSKAWKGDKCTLISGDKDWLQLVDEKTTWVDPIHDRQCTYKNFTAFTGCKTVWQFVEQKCVLGDSGDNIKGIHKVGEKTLEKVYQIYNSFYDFLNDENKEDTWKDNFDKNLPAALAQSTWEMENIMRKNEELMYLGGYGTPEPINLVEDRQALNEEAFKELCYRNAFLSFLKDLDAFLKPFRGNKFVKV